MDTVGPAVDEPPDRSSFLTRSDRVYYNRQRLSETQGMLHHVTCPACGGDGTILVENSAVMPRCPVCGHTLVVIPPSGLGDQAPVSTDQILEWLSETGETSSGASSSETACFSCGYSGFVSRDSDRAAMICPACGKLDRPRTGGFTRTFDCPNCGTAFELSQRDRGKTIVCARCKYFLGCVWPWEKPRWRLFQPRV
jgi:uncharacterized paraquat-inducible protein A